MKRIKFIILLILVFICSGCNIKYNISFSTDKISEVIEISNLNDNLQNDLIDPIHFIFQGSPYNILSNSSGATIKQGWLSINNFIENSILFKDYLMDDSIIIDGKKVLFNLKINENTKKYVDILGKIDNMELSLNIPYYVSSHNATKVNGNTYTWIIDDIDNERIKINFDMSKKYNYVDNTFSIIVIIGFSVIIFGVIIFFVIKNKKANEI